jgi:hypothetical protein
VAPGFINLLSWSVESLLHDGRGQSEIRQGVTTQILGEGCSWGPVNPAINVCVHMCKLFCPGRIWKKPRFRVPGCYLRNTLRRLRQIRNSCQDNLLRRVKVNFLGMVQFRVTLPESRGMGLVYHTRNLDKVEFQSPHCVAAVGVMETDHFIKLFFVMIK